MGSVRVHYRIESMPYICFSLNSYKISIGKFLDKVTLSRWIYLTNEKLASSWLAVKMTVCKYSGCEYACNSNTCSRRDYWL